MPKQLLPVILLVTALLPWPAQAAGGDAAPEAMTLEIMRENKKAERLAELIEDRSVSTQHAVTIDGKRIGYTATAGTLVLGGEDGTPKASMFYIAYTRDDASAPEKRPITFSFNGGPGSSSVWLHLGLLGPKRVLMDPEGHPLPPPYRLVENEHSLLDRSDLVFLDPVTTGYSRAVPGEDPSQFHGIEEDVETVGELIRLYLTRHQRWASPKFLIGESYGTTRAAGLAGYLQERHGIYLNGIMLVSAILNFQTARFNTGNDLPYPLFLPTYTATAWYHQQLPEDLQQQPLEEVLEAVTSFALGDYTLALAQGDRLDEEARNRLAERLARFTGLTPTYVLQNNLRVPIFRFVKELMRDERRTVGRLDSRFQGMDLDAAGEGYEYDPSYAAIQGPYTATLNDYLRRDLGFESDLPYEILSGRVRPWSYASYENRYANVAETLRQAMTRNPALRVFVANGYYDLATPFFATRYTFDHLGLDPSLVNNVSMGFYEAGHMMYIQEASLARLKDDLAAFLTSAIPD